MDINTRDSVTFGAEQSNANRERLQQLASQVPPDEELDLVAIEPPLEWIEEPNWTHQE